MKRFSTIALFAAVSVTVATGTVVYADDPPADPSVPETTSPSDPAPPEPTAAPETTLPPDTTAAPETTVPVETTVAPEPEVIRPYVVTFQPGVSAADQAAAVAAAGGVTTDTIAVLRIHAVDASDQAADALRANPAVISVELDRSRAVEAIPSDPNYVDQWALPAIGWDQAFGTITPAAQAVVAVLDTGVDATHPDLDSNVVGGASFVDGMTWASDPNGHGTAMAGIVAASTDNGTDIAGVGYAGVSVMPVTVLDGSGVGNDSNIIEGVVWATDHGADVILMAFSATGYSAALQAAIDYAWAHDVVLVAAAGNDGSSVPAFPAGDRGVMGVANTDQSDSLAAGSNYGDAIFLAAPGVDIVTTAPGGGTTSISGTSASAAHVAGAAALLAAADSAATNGVIVGRLARSADAAATQTETGNGRLNVIRALGDSSTESIKPSGAAPFGAGGPFVGPYVASAGQIETFLEAGHATDRATFERGDTVYAFASSMSTNANRAYRFRVLNPSGVIVHQSACFTGVATNSDSFATNGSNPLSGTTSYQYQIVEFSESGPTSALTRCNAGTPTSDTRADPFQLTQAYTFATTLARGLCVSEVTCAANDTTQFNAGATVWVRVLGYTQSKNNTSIRWIRPAGSIACENTNGSDRPDSSGAGIIDTSYTLEAGGETPDAVCPAITTAAGDVGTWRLLLSDGGFGTEFSVDLGAFTVVVNHDAGTLTIDKTGPAAIAHGGTITYTLDVSYAPGADGSPAQNILVSDDQCTSVVSGPDKSTGVDVDNDGDAFLEAGETWRYSCTYVVPALHSETEEDPIVNLASVSGQDLDGDAVTGDTDGHSVNVVHAAGTLTITKAANVGSVAHGGSVIYTFDATYAPGADGSPAQNIVVGDAQCTNAVSAPNKSMVVDVDNDNDAFLEAGETWRYTCTYAVPAHGQGEEDPILNTASVSGEDLDGDAVTGDLSNEVSVNITHAAGTLTIDKTGPAAVAHGGTITYTLDVSYVPGADGSPAQNIVVTDDQCSSAVSLPDKSTGVDPDNDADAFLEAGETWRYTCTYVVPALHADGEEDPILNTASVSGQDLDGDAVTPDVSNQVSVNVVHAAGTLTITKSANVSSIVHGGSVTYMFDVTYAPGADGSPAQNIVVSDAQCSSAVSLPNKSMVVDVDNDNDAFLEAGETWRYTCTYAVPALHADGEEDPILNIALASGQDLDGDAVTGDLSDQVSVNITHAAGTLTIDKTGPAAVAHGGTITYTLDVSYVPGADGSPAQNIVVTDDQCSSAVSLPDKSTGVDPDNDADAFLEAGETWRYSCTYVVPALHADGEEDPILNTASVSGQDLDGDAVTGDTDGHSVNVVHDSGTLTITKSANVSSVVHGGSVTYTFDVTYDSTDNAPATNVSVADDQCSAVYVSGDTDLDNRLDEGETWRYTCSVSVSALHTDDGEDDPFDNQATADGEDFDGDDLATASSNVVSVDIEHPLGTLSLTKSADTDGDLVFGESTDDTVAHGGSVTYRFQAAYDSADNAPATAVTLDEPDCVETFVASSDADSDGWLDEGETWTWTCTVSVGAHFDGEADPFINQASVDGEDFDGDDLATASSNVVSVDIEHDLGTLTIVKSADTDGDLVFGEPEDDTVAHGGSVTFRFEATYDSLDNAPATAVTLDEPDCVETFVASSDADSDGRLDEGETWTWTCTVTVGAHLDGEADPFTNQASVDGKDFDGDDLDADPSNIVSIDIEHDLGTLTILKSSVESAVSHGQTIHYGFDVTYSSVDNAPALNVVVSDGGCDASPAPVLDGAFNVGDSDDDGRLDEGETWEYTCSHAVGAHVSGESDPLTNTATVDGQDFDGDDLSADTSNTVSVDILHAPVVTISPTTTSVAESGVTEHTFTFTVTDEDPGDMHTIATGYPICGTAPQAELVTGSATTNGTTGGTFRCRYKDGPSSHTARIKVVDSTNQQSNVASSAVTVTNVNPNISITSPADFAQYPTPATVNVVAPFTDPGSLDTHTCTIDWDQAPALPETFAAAESGGNGNCNRTHTYTTPGVYTIKVTVTDKDGGSSSATVMIIVYDPNGGFITGGGFIQSPPGAYTPQDPSDPDLTGKANFGFVAKYQKGLAAGQTEFQFHAGNLNFHSEDYASLVVSGYKAQFRGNGTVNGVSGYKFTLTAYDGDVTGGGGVDRFRIRITKNGVVIYDNRYGASEDIDTADPLAISGGSIVIHKVK